MSSAVAGKKRTVVDGEQARARRVPEQLAPAGGRTGAALLLGLPQEAERALAELCESVRVALGAERVMLWRYDEASGRASVLRQAVSPAARARGLHAQRWRDVSLQESGLLAAVVLGRRPVVVDVANPADLPSALLSGLQIGSLRGDALLVGDTIVGGLTAEPAPADGDAYLRRTLPFLAALVAQATAWQEGEARRLQSEVLLELIESASRERSLTQLLAVACEQLARIGEVDRVCAFLRNGDRLVPSMARYADGRRDARTWELFRSDPTPLLLAEQVLRTGTPVAAERSDPLVAGWWADTLDIVSMLAVPIGRHPALAGVLTLDQRQRRPFPAELQRLAAAAGAHLGGVTRQAQVSRAREASLRASESVRELLVRGAAASSVNEAVRVLARVAQRVAGTERSAAYLVDAAGRITQIEHVDWPDEYIAVAREWLLNRPAAQVPLWQEAMRTREPLFIEDATKSALLDPDLVSALAVKSYVAIPVLCSGREVGLIVTASSRQSVRWTEQTADILRQLVLEGSIVVENAALRAAEQRRLAELAHEAQHDQLTGLPNRRAFRRLLETALRAGGPDPGRVAVLFLDLDRFKTVNDSLGHEAGDVLLTEIAARMQLAVGSGGVVARLGGDEFCILLERASRQHAVEVAESVVRALARPVALAGLEVVPGASIGVALWDRCADPAELMRAADVAMYRAKQRGRGRIEVHEPELPGSDLGDLQLEMALRAALHRQELFLHYQPQVDLTSGRIVGLEALVRWQRPGQPPVPPGRFLPVAERTGLISEVDAYVLNALVHDIAQFPEGLSALDLAVNCSAGRLLHPELVPDVRAAVLAVAPHRLVVEVTETALLSDVEAASGVLEHVRAAGALVALDDFGTGQSSLSHLKRFTVDQLKIDRSFVTGVTGSGSDRAIVASLVTMAASLGLSVVAEGVEQPAQLQALQELGCPLAQGFHLARPLPPERVIALVQQQPPNDGRRF